jgi:hypothetical protein
MLMLALCYTSTKLVLGIPLKLFPSTNVIMSAREYFYILI